jgi:hypothetical protein
LPDRERHPPKIARFEPKRLRGIIRLGCRLACSGEKKSDWDQQVHL